MNNSLSLYIHIPFCYSKCKYCDFFSVVCSEKISDSYICALKNEIKFRLQLNKCSFVKTIYIGGGTPSLLSKEQLSEILNTVKNCVQLEKKCEITLEMNPDDITEEKIQEIWNVGVTRLSVGIQSLNDDSLKFAGRRANCECNRKALKILKKCWKGQLSLDLISGLPLENKTSFLKGLEEVVLCHPHHISMYSLTIEEKTPFGKMYESGEVEFNFDESDDLWLCGKDFLVRSGYEQYEVSNFCLPGFECKHNLAYWNHENYIGCGSGATGTVYPLRWTNSVDIREYVEFWTRLNSDNLSKKQIEQIKLPQTEELIDKNVSEFEFFMMGLRKLSGIFDYEYEQLFNEKIPETVIDLFEKWQKKNLANVEKSAVGTRYALNEDGILFLNRFLEDLII